MMGRKEVYETGIYIQDIKNIVDYTTQNYESIQNVEYVATKDEKIKKNQILLSEEEIRRAKTQKDIS